ncbi:hypothetical protein FBEOM_3291 [Fusarium beomiforme]|uniref:Uncharacterized protein n=1 Tax=Fusarium beomiforme TaxID=44412 RepID=A0A9P5AQC8_9HYPO|nr:hypothetical protein FBEOM_3291 [Fusarium beomiforme]
MSSGYESESDVTSQTCFDTLSEIIERFKKAPDPGWLPNIRFGHLTVPVCLGPVYAIMDCIASTIRQTEFDSPVIFILSRHEQRLCNLSTMNELPILPDYQDKTLEYSWFSSVLEGNRTNEGPGGWKQVENKNEWELNLSLPKEAFIIFSVDPYMSADCALALTGLVQWACDTAERQGANIRVLTTSSHFGNQLLSELVSIRSQYPVTHYELPIPTYVDVIPADALDNSEGDEMFDRIETRALARDEDDKHALLFVPPLVRTDIWPNLGPALSRNDLLIKHINDDGPLMEWHLTAQNGPATLHDFGTVIDVDVEHPIPSFLYGYSHAQIVLGKRCFRKVFDKDVKQVVYTQLALTQHELNDLQWWCYQPDITPGNITIYLGADGLRACEDAPVYAPRHVENDHAAGFIAGVYAISHWGVDVGRVLQAFVKSPGIVFEMEQRLQKVGIIHPRAQKLCLGDSQEAVFKAVLHLVRYDHRLAHFIALKSSDPQVRRLKVQLAVAMVLAKDWFFETHGEVILCGWGVRDYVTWGDLWLNMGLWKRLSSDHEDFENLSVSDTSIITDAYNTESLPAQGAFIFRQMTTALEEILNGMTEYPDVCLPPHRIRNEVGDLDIHQMKQLLRHFLCSHLYQATKSHLVIDAEDHGHLEHILLSSRTKLELRSSLFPLTIRTFMDLEEDGIVYGICTLLVLEEDTLIGTRWTYVPHDLIAEWF